MFDHLPIIKTSKATYYQFTFVLSIVAIVLTMMILGVIYWVVRCLVGRAKLKYQELDEISGNEIPMRRIGERPASLDGGDSDTDRPRENEPGRCYDTKTQGRLRIVWVALEAALLFCLTCLFDVFVAYDYLPANFLVALFKLVLIFPLWFLAINRFLKILFVSPEMIHRLRKWIIPLVIVLFIYCYSSVTFYAGFCMCIHNNTTPGLNIMKFHFSTAWGRYHMDPTCPDEQKPCIVYPTLPENGLNDVFFNFHVNPASCAKNTCDPTVEYQKVGDSTWSKIRPVKNEYDHPESEYSRREIYTALVENLDENSTYLFKFENSAWNNPKSEMYSYKTFNKDNFSILLGGDVGNKQGAVDMNKNVVSKLNFDMIMIGGDIAYDNGVPTCYRAVDYFLKRLPYDRYDEETNSTRVVPLMIALGNHDAGVNSYVGAEIPHTKHEPIFKHYFPQNTVNGKVPNVTERRSYFQHKLGNKLQMFFLDAGYYSPMEGNQTAWLHNHLEASNAEIKMAQYHGPIVTAVRHTSDPDYKVIKHGKEEWIPLFDKYNMTIVSENHSHVFKRSKKLLNFEESEEGTVYLGEGSWGIHVDDNPPHVDPQWFVKWKITQHIWHLEFTQDRQIIAKAYDEKFNMLDEAKYRY
ncbi:unnamed protein product [Moneuplotes crassus]|uniref:Calcineurin-like phosphoesterase domain-containing protein n=1 Tax=Euplotes crassus TaxID=5936 RepID=A0AAD1X6X3_EUPCR|nr:unnamed protein product [Moneuplotes crassus]